ncbi:conserved exported hypothetical protein [Candidatus Terasakiella magnetica]|nr:conserved exported hypothetical protein [Candidatus Terasakiella magnetica]
MRSLILAVLPILMLLGATSAQAAKPKKCLSLPEITAEREIRHGIFMRESSNRCDGRFLRGSAQMWQKFEQANGTKLRAANGKRLKAWEREFPTDWRYKINYADGRLVTYDRNIPLTAGFCENVEELLQEVDKRGYAAFSAQAKLLQNEVVEDYKVCQ